ncbi:hypothetical protein, partial [Pseudomonas syringae group genomosp. 7]|uniref:hypothetical protein n=1 Tax=Pseudomonas syringae group genomosp. 7 TaxID=251699 RepID=UPI003770735E
LGGFVLVVCLGFCCVLIVVVLVVVLGGFFVVLWFFLGLLGCWGWWCGLSLEGSLVGLLWGVVFGGVGWLVVGVQRGFEGQVEFGLRHLV